MSLSDEAKGALWKLRSKSYKPGYLYYPAGKVWLPAQCDLEGRLVIDPTDLDTRYHKKDENVDIGALKIVADEFVIRNAATFTGVEFYNPAETAPAHVRFNNVYLNSIIGQANPTAISTQIGITQTLNLRSYDTTHRICIQLVGGYADIPRAGDVTPVAGKKLDMRDTNVDLRLPIAMPATPVNGSLWWDLATNELKAWDEGLPVVIGP